MFILWDENSPQTGLILCISIVLIVVLLWYICKQEYNTACDRRIIDLQYQAHVCKGDYPARALSKYQSINKKDNMTNSCTMLEKHKKIIDPEREVMIEHYLGDDLRKERKEISDPISLDPFADLKSSETTDQRLYRNLSTADYDGPQLEGMMAPISEFENDSLSRQLVKQQEIYGEQEHTSSGTDQLANMNL